MNDNQAKCNLPHNSAIQIKLKGIEEFYSTPSALDDTSNDGDFETHRIQTAFIGGIDAQQYIAYINSNASAILFSLDDPIQSIFPKSTWNRVQKALEKYDVGSRLDDKKRYDEAAQIYWESLKIFPTPEAFVNLAYLSLIRREPEDAELFSRRAIKTTRVTITGGLLNQNEFDVFAVAYANLGTALQKQGKLEEAEAALRKCITINPKNVNAYENLGPVLCDLRKYSEAEIFFQKLIALDPDNYIAHSWLGAVYKAQESWALSEYYLQKAIAYNKSSDLLALYLDLIQVLLSAQRAKDAETVAKRALATNPTAEILYLLLGDALKEQNRFREAAEAYFKLGILLVNQNRSEEAEDVWHNAIETDPDYAPAYCNLGILLVDQNRVEEAEESFRDAIKADPNYSLAYFNLGILFSKQNRMKAANSMIEKAIQIDPGLRKNF